MSQLVPIRKQDFRAIPGNEYNILLLGQTGVGKSTFINALYNYWNSESLDAAMRKDPVSFIGSTICVSDEDYQVHNIKFGTDPNENMESQGQSATQSCKSYKFHMNNFSIRLIDTPGIGDTRGIDKDRTNLNGIVRYLSNYAKLYAICILLKPNEARLTPSFSFCIQELLCHLHTNASNNIVFIYTNSRSTLYRPGETGTPLKTLLDQVRSTPPYPKIPYAKDNIFCLDNEAFKFLVALKNHISFSSEDRESFGRSWSKSVEECRRLIKYIVEGSSGQGMTPHNVKDTLDVNRARDAILELVSPITDLKKNIQVNKQKLNERIADIRNSQDSEDKLRASLYIPFVTIAIKDVTEPRTVCTGPKCREPYKVENLVQYHYPQICHNPCYLKEVPPNVVGDLQLRYCAAIDQQSTYCNECGCHYSVHLHIYYDSVVINTRKVDETIENQLKNKEGLRHVAQNMVTILEKNIQRYKGEEKTLTESTAKLAVFLKRNAMLVHNDAFKEYLEQIIEKEKVLSGEGSNNTETIKGLQKMLEDYETEKQILGQGFKMTIKDVDKIIDEITNMQISGVILKQARQAQRRHK